MAPAEHQCARAVEGFEERKPLRVCEAAKDGKAGEQQKERRERRHAHSARDWHCNVSGRCRRPSPAEPQPGKAAQQDSRDLGD